MRRYRSEGFTIIELLMVVAIIAVLAAIAIANYLNALERGRQKRTMADIRSIAQAWEQRAAETRSYTSAGVTFPSAVTYSSVRAMLVPQYIQKMPTYDAWGFPLEFGAAERLYGIRSSGRDGVFEADSYENATVRDPDCDIVYANGNFVQFPDVVQSD
jgi:prepilin-type N-terminal cleavage/methylation domain-containing protein